MGIDRSTLDQSGVRLGNNKVGVDGSEGDESLLKCPKGVDPDKWARMSVQDKLNILGIDMHEWHKMTREQ